MALLSADNPRLFNAVPVHTIDGNPHQEFAVAASTVIYKGGAVGLDTSGYLVMWLPPTVGTTVVGGYRFVGIAREHIASQTAAGAKRCLVQTGGTIAGALASSTVADIGKPVWLSDNATLSKLALGNAYLGRIVDWISATEVIVRMDGFYNGTGGRVSAWSPIISVAAANIVTVIPKSWNASGLYVREVIGVCTTDISTTPVITIQDTAGTTLGITFSPTSATDALEVGIMAGGAIQLNPTDTALVYAPVGLGIDVVTTASGTGAMKFWIEAIPAT